MRDPGRNRKPSQPGAARRRAARGALLALAFVAGAAAAAGDAARGKALFAGRAALQGRAMPCIGCHHASGVGALGGGTLAADLSDAGTRYDAETIVPLLKDMPFPAMQAVYGPRPLSDAEIADLAAFLARQTAPAGGGATLAFFGWGLGGMLVLAGAAQLVWRRRLKDVRRALAQGR